MKIIIAVLLLFVALSVISAIKQFFDSEPDDSDCPELQYITDEDDRDLGGCD